MRKGTIRLEDITLYDLLTADTHGGKISIQDNAVDSSYDLIRSRSVFFSPDGLFAEVERNGLILFRTRNQWIWSDSLRNGIAPDSLVLL